VLEDPVVSENLFANVLAKENISKWKLSQNITISAIAGGIRLDNKMFGRYSASCTVDVPEKSAGRPVKLELDVKSISKMAWPLTVYVTQLDKNGKVLPEHVIQHRWISQMRPVNVLTPYRESGFIHPQAKKIRITFSLHSTGSSFDNHGLPLKNPDDVTPHLEVTRLVLRSAETLPFPKYNDIFFGTGITGSKDDSSLVLNDRRNLFFPTRSVAMWGGQTGEIRNESEFYFPTGDGTIEAYIYPEWNTSNRKRVMLFHANSFLLRTKKYAGGRGDLFSFSYQPATGNTQITIKDADNKIHKAVGKAKIAAKTWNHIAVQWSYNNGIQLYVNGKLAISQKCAVKPIDISKEEWPNDCHASQFTIGNTTGAARGKNIVPWHFPNFTGKIDALRISNIARYRSDFTPDKQPQADKNTNVIFNFDRSFDGKTLFGVGRVEGSIRSLQSRISPKLEIGKRSVQYVPAEILPESDPRVVLDPLNYPRTPSVNEFKSARKTERIKMTMAPGESRNVKLDSDVIMDFVEIANNTGKTLVHPFLIKKGEIDPRSFGDLADSLGIDGLTPRGKVDKIFQFLLSASDYFMNHQATFRPGSNEPENVEYKALMMLNGYCGFECGPLNNLSANLFTTAGLCPATQTSGYGHSFEQVFYDGKNHVYDLSAQRFFPAHDNETAASLRQLDVENGPFQRYRNSGGAFIRQG
ncbi:MAG: LamG domain-containing protein, partial [Lentisphaeria bacterium]|nr:LamG domain-containing protein [Lentisphaeria bacterium]